MKHTSEVTPGSAIDRLKTVRHFVSNDDGWHLCLHQTWDVERLKPGLRPILIVPCYGMNSFIFSFHPRGLSLEEYLAESGFEVWRVDLRAQGGSVYEGRGRKGDGEDYRIEDVAVSDLGAAIDAALKHTLTGADRADVIGCSLGGTFMYVHAVLNPRHRIGSMIAMGSPVRWVSVNPLLKLAFSWPMLVGAIRIRGTRKLAELALPHLVDRVPWLLSAYINPEVTDLSAAREMVRTVEDPNRHINREIARWIRDGDLVIRGVNISEALSRVTCPLLCVLANGDGIVPRETAAFPLGRVASRTKRLLEVGDRDMRLAHADLFICNEAHGRVFAPMVEWLRAAQGSAQESPAAEVSTI